MYGKFQRIRKLASGAGTVAYSRSSTNAFVVTVWTEETDRFTAVEAFPFFGHLDEIAARQMVKGYVDTYAASN